jgi:dipeptidyl aminopeptidase/acylaminoacyl peptidase
MTVSDAMRRMPRGFWAVAAFVLVAGRVWGADAPAPIAVEEFFKKPAISEAEISPTGRHVALVAADKEGHNRLVVFDTQTLKGTVVASFERADVANVHWISGKRLVYSFADPERQVNDVISPAGLYAVDIDGSDYRYLIRLPVNVSAGRLPPVTDPATHFFSPTWRMDSDDVFAIEPKFNSGNRDLDYVALLRLNTRTGAVARIGRSDAGETLRWSMGSGDMPQFVTVRDQGSKAGIDYLSPSKTWIRQQTFDRATGEGWFNPIGVAGEEEFYAVRRAPGSDYDALYIYDAKTKTFSNEPVLEAKGFDLRPVLVRRRDTIIGVHYLSDAASTAWFDAGMKKAQAKIDALLPGTVNRISVPLRAEVPLVLVTAFSESDPGQFLLYNLETEKLVQLGRERPGIDPAAMGRRDFVRLKARDGLDLPVWVTTPRDGKKGPRGMVVLVHGGPWRRGGAWQWYAESQFLASRGYVVLEPEFRGSVGFGFQHFKAGWKQWGLAMQNDVADATRWAIDKAYADPKRICIAGADYGGYAALMGLINDSQLYRCGVEWAGITDIELLYSITWSDSSEEAKSFGIPALVADREKDAAQIKATSPVQQASRIKQPLLMGYGGRDARVPLKHGTELRDEVQKTNSGVELVVYPDGAHILTQVKDRVDWWTRVEKFLARNIGDEAQVH